MRLLLLSALLFLAAPAFTQTDRIAAHSRSSSTIRQQSDQFPGLPRHIPGLPSHIILHIDSIVFLNDSMVVQYTNLGNHVVHNHAIANDPKISADSLKKIYPNTKLVGFEKKTLKAGFLKPNFPADKSSSWPALLAFLLAGGGVALFLKLRRA